MNRSQKLAFAFASLALLPSSLPAAGRRLSADQLATDAERVVLGTVLSHSSHWTADGRIESDYVVSPDVTLKGEDENSVVITVPGGEIGELRMEVSDTASFKDGEQVLVFVRKRKNSFEVVGRGSGKFTVQSEAGASAVKEVIRSLQSGGSVVTDRVSRAQAFVTNATTNATVVNSLQVGCYGTSGAKWGSPSATYKFASNIPSAWYTALNASTASWSAAGANFKMVNDQNSGNSVTLVDLAAKYGSSYGGAFALTTTWMSGSTITQALTEINTAYSWSTSGEANMGDIQNVMTHEFGHWLHLDDVYDPSTCSEVTMWGSAGFGETKKQTLEQADIDGLVSLYGTGGSGGTGGGGTTATVSAPKLTSPANGAAGVTQTPVLSWNAATNATSYDVYFGNSTSSMTLVASVAGTSFQTGALAVGTTYYWSVVAKNSSSSASSSTWSFTTTTGTPTSALTAPMLLTPSNGASGVSTAPLLSWSPVVGATSYSVYIGTSGNPSLYGTFTSTSVQVSGLRAGGNYKWKVVARDSGGNSATSSTWQFRTK